MLLENWMKSYKPEELFDEVGALKPELAALAPKGNQRMGANPHANGGILLKDLRMPDFRDYALDLRKPGVVTAEATRVAGVFSPRHYEVQSSAAKLPCVWPG
jgi:xylulose-5-phosphate/fructose-6-phosphate phosphoketolase